MGAEWTSLRPAHTGFNISRDLLATSDGLGNFLSLNAAWETCLGWSRAELMARPVVAFLHPDDVESTMNVLAHIASCDYEVANFENRFSTRDGKWRWLRWNSRTDGTMWVGVAIDVTEERQAEQHLRHAMSHQGFLLYGQPILHTRSRRLVQRELLVRMQGSNGESDILLPADFIPAAERFGLVGQIDRWVTCRGLALARRGRPVEINLSAQTVDDEEFADELLGLLRQAPEIAANLVFEITETAAIGNLDAAQRLANTLSSLGCRLALDDFGTGFGSFTYLRSLPVDYLKIDSSFVLNLVDSPEDQAVVRSMVHIAESFGRSTVAEGVENQATLGLLFELGVDYVQGYFTGRPVPVLA